MRSILFTIITLSFANLLSVKALAQQVRFSIDTEQMGLEIHELPPRLDIVAHSHDKKSVDIVAPRETFEHLQKIGLNPTLIETQKLAAQEAYLNPKEISEKLKQYAYQYPEMLHLEEIGRSLQGEAIYAARLSLRNNLESKPAIFFNGMHHARELMTTEVTMDIIDYILTRAGSIEHPEIAEWLEHLQIWVVPQINPDGNWIVWNEDSWWRKNARGNSNSIWGVDLNRNYPYRWGACRGSSSSKGSQTYRGTAEASEPETRVLMEFAKRINPVISVSYHSYSELVISPYGCRGHQPTEVSVLDFVGAPFAKALVKDSGNGSYAYGPAWDELYPVDGDDISWLHEHLNTLAYVVEIGSSRNGFQPDYNTWRDSMVKRQRPGWIFLLNQLMAGPQVRFHFYDSTTRERIDASVRFADKKYQASERARESRGGFLAKVLTPGTHQLRIQAAGYQTKDLSTSVRDLPEIVEVYLDPKN